MLAIIPTAQKHRLRVAIQSLDGKVLQEVDMDQTGRPPVVSCEPTNIAGEPVVGETAEYPLRLGLEDFTGQQNVASDVNQQSMSCMLGRPQEHTSTCHDQVDLDPGVDEQGLLDRAREA